MTQPLDRHRRLPPKGSIDRAAGEFWVENPFLMPKLGHNLSAFERNRMFLSVEGGQFVDASFASGADIDSDSRSVVVGDFDRDECPDLLVASAGGGPLRLFRNQFPSTSHRLRINLVGRTSNRRGIGARVVAQCGDRQIVRDVFPSNGMMGQSPPELILGLGAAKRVDRLTVRWPTGKSQQFQDVRADSSITITEDGALEIERETR